MKQELMQSAKSPAQKTSAKNWNNKSKGMRFIF